MCLGVSTITGHWALKGELVQSQTFIKYFEKNKTLVQVFVTSFSRNVIKVEKVRKMTYNQWKNIAWCRFCSLFFKIIRRRKGLETQNCPSSSFSHNFCHWLSKHIKKLKSTILQLVVLNHVESMQLPITSLWYKSEQFLEPKEAA